MAYLSIDKIFFYKCTNLVERAFLLNFYFRITKEFHNGWPREKSLGLASKIKLELILTMIIYNLSCILPAGYKNPRWWPHILKDNLWLLQNSCSFKNNMSSFVTHWKQPQLLLLSASFRIHPEKWWKSFGEHVFTFLFIYHAPKYWIPL